jgi:small subunit ribosomal protein S2
MAETEEQPREEATEAVENKIASEETYMTAGVHIGTRQKTADMTKYIYKVRNDGLYIIDVNKTDDRVQVAAQFIAKYKPENVLVVSVRQYGQKPIRKLGEYTNIQVLAGRFRPGTLTNPNARGYLEPELLIITDPLADAQALREARNVGIPVVALCDTNNETKHVDIIIPTNNKGRRALALVYWLLSREVYKVKGKIESYDDFQPEVEDFEAEI